MSGTLENHLDHHLLCIHDLHFSYGQVKVLENIDFCVEKGEYLGILGPNGSGKTTLLKLILGLLDPGEGRIELLGQSIKQFNQWKKIGFVPQKATQMDTKFPITVKEVVSLNSQSNTATLEALKQVDMEKYKDRLITELSGGQQQRVFIAKALAGRPELLILDEPTVGIDPTAQKDFYSLLTTLNKDLGITLIIVSHDTDVIVKEVSRIICIDKRMVCHVTPKEFISGNYIDKLYGEERKHIIHHHDHEHA
ncbi:MAG TPA: metal ABC transporter ATP-binding protein [Patescibacteria group bacterium]